MWGRSLDTGGRDAVGRQEIRQQQDHGEQARAQPRAIQEIMPITGSLFSSGGQRHYKGTAPEQLSQRSSTSIMLCRAL